MKNPIFKVFLELLKGGLWGTEPAVKETLTQEQWDELLKTANEQTVAGTMLDGILLLPTGLQPERKTKLKWVYKAMHIEDDNKKMNILIKHLTPLVPGGVLLKGQRVGACYRVPQHRLSGDIDLFFYHPEDYELAKKRLCQVAQRIGGEETRRKHFDCTVKGYVVELHGEIKVQIKKQTDKNLPLFIQKYFTTGTGTMTGTQDYQTAPLNFDAVFIFVHLLQHYFNSGVGLRQVCDWLVFLNYYHNDLDRQALQEDIDTLGIRKEWQVFGAMAVNRLGFPAERMPLYVPGFEKAGDTVLGQIFRSGNFGRTMYYNNRPRNILLGKLYTLMKNTGMRWRNLWIFPEEAIYGIPLNIKGGIERVFSPKT